MTIETLTRPEAEMQRDALVHDLNKELGTTEREELRDMTLSGDLTFAEIARVERLVTLDYLLGE